MPTAAPRDQLPSWRPDPTGRHDYRWWTGVEWSDQVGDRGAVSIDPGSVPAVERPAAAAFRRRRYAVAAVVGMLVVASVAGVVWSRRDESDLGVETLTFDQATGTVARAVSLEAGDVVRVRVEPSTRIDTAVLVVVGEALARQQAVIQVGDGEEPDAFADRVYRDVSEVLAGPAAAAYPFSVVIGGIDSGGVGRPDAGRFTALAAGEYRFVVAVDSGRPAGLIRTVVERHETSFVPGETDPSRFYAAPFFTDPAFFTAAVPYTPAG